MGRSKSSVFPTTSFAVILGLAPAALSAQAPGDTLRLGDVLAMAAERNPGLTALRHGADAASLREPAASALPDPMLQFGFMNFGLPEFNTDMAMSMAPAVQLNQTFPWPGKLGQQETVAVRDRYMALARADEAAWRLHARTTSVFFEIWSLDRRLEVMAETLELLGGFREVALAMYGTGSGRQSDVLRADVEIARTSGEIRRMEGRRQAAVSVLNGILDRPADTPIGAVETVALPRDLPAWTTLEGWAVEDRPLLAEAALGVERAAAVAARADREIWPDLRLGLAYGQRDRGFGCFIGLQDEGSPVGKPEYNLLHSPKSQHRPAGPETARSCEKHERDDSSNSQRQYGDIESIGNHPQAGKHNGQTQQQSSRVAK